jgi:hypothetical protein
MFGGICIFCRSLRKDSALKDRAGALHTDGGTCTLSAGQEVKWKSWLRLTGDGRLPYFAQR